MIVIGIIRFPSLVRKKASAVLSIIGGSMQTWLVKDRC